MDDFLDRCANAAKAAREQAAEAESKRARPVATSLVDYKEGYAAGIEWAASAYAQKAGG